ncbi:MAG: hypothetical protein J3R72DRAFT_434260 [Linnemannia gamsii]|nr:MAG: hypothetical protein J3R72DRAFT_434260 [Linnemannia gamsii]
MRGSIREGRTCVFGLQCGEVTETHRLICQQKRSAFCLLSCCLWFMFAMPMPSFLLACQMPQCYNKEPAQRDMCLLAGSPVCPMVISSFDHRLCLYLSLSLSLLSTFFTFFTLLP